MNEEFVANMEDVLDVYALSYDHKFPVVCVDEYCKQLLEEVRPPLPARSGEIARKDDEYIGKVLAEIFSIPIQSLPFKNSSHLNWHGILQKEWKYIIRQNMESCSM